MTNQQNHIIELFEQLLTPAIQIDTFSKLAKYVGETDLAEICMLRKMLVFTTTDDVADYASDRLDMVSEWQYRELENERDDLTDKLEKEGVDEYNETGFTLKDWEIWRTRLEYEYKGGHKDYALKMIEAILEPLPKMI